MKTDHRISSLIFVLFLTLTVIISSSCSSRRDKSEHKNLIPEKDLIKILTDIHIADGLLRLPRINYLYSRSDSISPYIEIIESHGYTKELMDKTIRYYFIRHPKRLIRMYDKVLGNLSEMEAVIDKEIPKVITKVENIWPHYSSCYFFSSSGSPDTAWIDFPISFYGTYNLQFTLTLYPDDESIKPVCGIFLSRTDSTGHENRIYFPTTVYLKDGQPHRYNIFINNNLQAPLRIKGWFIDRECTSPYLNYHFRIDDIVLSRRLLQR